MNNITRTRRIGTSGPGQCTEPVFSLRLLGSFALSRGGIPVRLQQGAQRLFALLALQGRPVSRATIAGTLWPDASEEQASSCLRSALSRIDEATRAALTDNGLELAVTAEVVVLDLSEAKALAHRVLRADSITAADDMTTAAIEALSSELLPDWYDDWATIEAEDWRRLRVHALDAMTERFAAAGQFWHATAAARAAIAVDPLRESAHAALIRVHLAQGNQSEALKVFAAYESLLNEELRIPPTAHIQDLVRDIQRHRRASDAPAPY